MSAPRRPIAPAETIPPLEPGDRLTRAEFERRYDLMPNVKKAELIEGVVCMPSPVRWSRHGEPHFRLMMWLSAYVAGSPGVFGGDNSTMRLDLENLPQPDAALIIDPKCGGQAKISKDDYLEQAPELIAEVSASSVSFDLHTKFHVYRRSGVREYVVWRVMDQIIDWFVLENDDFLPLAPEDGILKSRIFPGLWLDPAALIRDDRVRLAEVVQRGLASPSHREFVQRLLALAP
ncbi:MAG: Uma2 family endonuclease [Gemmataceae bacterium]|nr:Uma2 family endonuclease [Gemmataceae bacterium]